MSEETTDTRTKMERALDLPAIDSSEWDAESVLAKVRETKDLPEDQQERLGVDNALLDIYEKAIKSYSMQHKLAQETEPKYRSRAMEIANSSLTIALKAIEIRQSDVTHKERMSVEREKIAGKGGEEGGKTTNNIIIADDRNAVLDRIMNKNKSNEEDSTTEESGETIDGEYTEEKDDSSTEN